MPPKPKRKPPSDPDAQPGAPLAPVVDLTDDADDDGGTSVSRSSKRNHRCEDEKRNAEDMELSEIAIELKSTIDEHIDLMDMMRDNGVAAPANERTMFVTFCTLTGKSTDVLCDANDTVAMLKLVYSQKEKIPFDQFRVIYNGRIMENIDTPAKLGMTNGAKLHVVLKLSGS